MDIILQLYGTLTLTLLGFALPILSIAIATLPEGVKCLLEKYENEKKQSEENLINENEKKTKGDGLDYKDLAKTIKTLRKKKNEATSKLSYLEPRKLILRIFVPFFLSLFILVFALKSGNTNNKIVFLFFSIVSFVGGLIALWNSVMILVEVSDAVNKKKQNHEEKMIELLTTLADKGGAEHLFLKPGQISTVFNGKLLKILESFEFSVNKPHKIPVSIKNTGEFMAKNVEAGLVFPKDFLIEKTPNISLFTDESKQIVRLNSDIVQAHEEMLKDSLNITFLKAGSYEIDTFVKGENVKFQRFTFNIRVIE